MFQKHSIMSLKKKSKSLGHLHTALGSPNFGSPKMKKHISVKNFNERLKFLNHSNGANGDVANNNSDSNNASSAASTRPSRLHHAPPTRSTTALSLGSPVAPAENSSSAVIKQTTPKVSTKCSSLGPSLMSPLSPQTSLICISESLADRQTRLNIVTIRPPSFVVVRVRLAPHNTQLVMGELEGG